jgi:hypothetical protein
MPIWDWGILKGGAIAQPLYSGATTVDLGGRLSALQAFDRVDWGRFLRIESSDQAHWQWFKLFLDTVCGARVAFLLPTGRPDLVAIGDASSGILTIEGVDVDYLGDWFPSLAHRRIRIVKTDGTSAYRTVTTAEDAGATQNLTLSSALVGAIDHIEFLETCRLEADSSGRTEVVAKWDDATFFSAIPARVVQQ